MIISKAGIKLNQCFLMSEQEVLKAELKMQIKAILKHLPY